jgi:[acyl-carrier-protein] S-malonyltransferase
MSNNNIAFLFPGQGSQKIGMLAAAYQRFDVVKQTFVEASDTLGYDVWDLIHNGEQQALNLTETTQPALLTSSVALWRAWVAQGGVQPSVMAGHSLGEFSALVCAGALQFSDAVLLVKQRGAFMQAAVPVGVGAMAAIIGLDDDAINSICDRISSGDEGVVAAVNFNSPGQVVIAGHAGTVEQAITALKEAGAKRALPLPVSAPFHTELMKPAGEKLAEAISAITISSPTIPVIHNVHAQTEANTDNIAALLVEQISSPVQWTACVQAMIEAGAQRMVECGPGKVLSGLNRRIDKSLSSYSVEEPDSLESSLTELAG